MVGFEVAQTRPTGVRFSATEPPAYGSTISQVPSAARP
jgi:hypothetical protein